MVPISPEESLRRHQANEDVLGTHAMEGLKPDAQTLVLLDRFAKGELDRAQLSAEIDRHVESLLIARGHLIGAA